MTGCPVQRHAASPLPVRELNTQLRGPGGPLPVSRGGPVFRAPGPGPDGAHVLAGPGPARLHPPAAAAAAAAAADVPAAQAPAEVAKHDHGYVMSVCVSVCRRGCLSHCPSLPLDL